MKWYFSQLSPTGTLLAIEPCGERHVVKGCRLDSPEGRALFNRMIGALSSIPAGGCWTVFNSAGACEADDLSLPEAQEWIDDERFAKGWTGVYCLVVNSSDEWPDPAHPPARGIEAETEGCSGKPDGEAGAPKEPNATSTQA